MNQSDTPTKVPLDGAVRPGAYRHFEGMCWPVPGDRLDELERALRFADQGAVFTMSDRLVIASFLSAYRELVALPGRLRDERVRELRKGPRTDYGTTPHITTAAELRQQAASDTSCVGAFARARPGA